MDWQPISTAPTDGTKVLVGRFIGNKAATRDGRVRVDWFRTDTTKNGYIGWGEFNMTHWPPTHWMPIPNPPKTGDNP